MAEDAQRRPAATRWCAAAAALVATLAASFLAAEVALRRGAGATEPYLRWTYRDEGTGGGPRLLILGDSFFTRWAGGDDVEQRLREGLRGTGVRILNPSVPGYGPYQYLETLIAALARTTPDVVLVSHYVGNDLMDVGCGADASRRLRRITAAAPSLLERSFVVQHVAALAREYFMRHPGFDWSVLTEAGIPEDDVARARRFELNPYVVALGATYPRYYRDTLLFESACAARAWANTQHALDDIVRRASAAGARVVPVIFPHTLQVSRLHHDLYRRWRIEVSDDVLDARQAQDRLLDHYRARGVEALDLLPAFEAATAQLFWDDDEHLNPAGNALAGAEIARFLLERGVVAPRPLVQTTSAHSGSL
ncbi:MAG: hypothetical protein AB1689_21410 [Thermodesulfobacteriota bacterium]